MLLEVRCLSFLSSRRTSVNTYTDVCTLYNGRGVLRVRVCILLFDAQTNKLKAAK